VSHGDHVTAARKRADGPTLRRGRPIGRSSEETRSQVIVAARRPFTNQGYSGASMRGIAAEAGFTAMTLYTYAESKAELFELVWKDSIDRIYDDYAEVIAGRDSLGGQRGDPPQQGHDEHDE
jgi:AcrR family transcriptional regulator